MERLFFLPELETLPHSAQINHVHRRCHLLIQYNRFCYFISILVKVPWRLSQKWLKHAGNKLYMMNIFHQCSLVGILHKLKYSFNAQIQNIWSSIMKYLLVFTFIIFIHMSGRVSFILLSPCYTCICMYIYIYMIIWCQVYQQDSSKLSCSIMHWWSPGQTSAGPIIIQLSPSS